MRLHATLLLLSATAALAACADQSGPAPTAATVGTASPPLQQRAFEQPHSANAAGGPATITGATGSGRPTIERTDTGAPGIGGAPQVQPSGSRGSRQGP